MDHIQIRGKRVNIKKLVFAIAILIVFVFLLVKFVPDLSKTFLSDEDSMWSSGKDIIIVEEETKTEEAIGTSGIISTARASFSSGGALSVGGSSSETTESLFTEKKIINRANFQIEVEDY